MGWANHLVLTNEEKCVKTGTSTFWGNRYLAGERYFEICKPL
jgi:hypothetical protein